jgi:hypothetical protein
MDRSDDIPWHPAFFEALQADLADYRDVLKFEAEYQLTSEPLRIDVIVKKREDAVIQKSIARIFRQYNIFEYKSPSDYISVGDFYKVYGYACLYIWQKNLSPTELTLTLVESRHPRDLFVHLEKARDYRIDEAEAGIYTITGDFFPIQIIESRKLALDNYLFLKNLDEGLSREQFETLLYAKNAPGIKLGAYKDVLLRANHEIAEEVNRMKKQEFYKWFWDQEGFNDLKTELIEKTTLETAEMAKVKTAEKVAEKAAETAIETTRWVTRDNAKKSLAAGVAPDLVQKIFNLSPDTVQSLQAQI